MNTKEDKLISIIIPIFNVENYIRKCLNSVIKQSYYNIEILLINDGSTDNSGKICDEYSLKDSRIKVIHKKNGGVSSARNSGLEVAKGEYIGFVDGDDWIDSGMYESMYQNIVKYNADVCICNYVIEQQNKSQRKIELPFSLKILNKQDVLNNVITKMISPINIEDKSEKMHGGVCRLLIKHEILKKNNINFPDNFPFMEDRIFSIQLFFKSNVVSVDKEFHYHYFNHPNTASIKFRENLFELLVNVNTKIEHIIKDEKVFNDLKERIRIQYIKFTIMSIVNEVHPDNKRKIKEKIKTISLICSSKKLKNLLAKSDDGNSLRKKIIIKALQKNYALFLFSYYYLATSLVGIKKKHKKIL